MVDSKNAATVYKKGSNSSQIKDYLFTSWPWKAPPLIWSPVTYLGSLKFETDLSIQFLLFLVGHGSWRVDLSLHSGTHCVRTLNYSFMHDCSVHCHPCSVIWQLYCLISAIIKLPWPFNTAAPNILRCAMSSHVVTLTICCQTLHYSRKVPTLPLTGDLLQPTDP